MRAIEPIFEAYREGRGALLAFGRCLLDFDVTDDGRIQTLREGLRRVSRVRHGLLLVSYSRAHGIDWDATGLSDRRDRDQVESALRFHGLDPAEPDEPDAPRVLRGLSSLLRTAAGNTVWSDGRPMRFLALFEYAEHMLPPNETTGDSGADQELRELTSFLASSQSLRQAGNLAVFHVRHRTGVSELVRAALHPVALTQPRPAEKQQFLKAARLIYPKACFESPLDDATVSNLTVNTPNRGLEGLLAASHRAGRRISARELSEQKNSDVSALSEGTLTVLDTARVRDLSLAGQNILVPRQLLERWGEALLRADPRTPANILLVGPPGTGKTDLALFAAERGKAAAYRLLSPKGSLVGETERKARLQQEALRHWTPNVGFVDEITEALPMSRDNLNLDSGASQAVTAELLTALSDESRRGHSLLVATTNRPWVLGAAMRSRFTAVPVLHPLRQDLPAIIESCCRRIDPAFDPEGAADAIRDAAEIFDRCKANPRHIYGALSTAASTGASLDAERIVEAARDFTGETDWESAAFADLWAVRVCPAKSFLPWTTCPDTYPFPDHLAGLVDPRTGNIDRTELARRIEEFEPHARL